MLLFFYSLKSLIPNAKKSNPIIMISQITPPLKNVQAEVPKLKTFDIQNIAAIDNKITPTKSSNHLFM